MKLTLQEDLFRQLNRAEAMKHLAQKRREEIIRLRAALDAITAVRRDGCHNSAAECRKIAQKALNGDSG